MNEKLTKLYAVTYQDASTTTLDEFTKHAIHTFNLRTTVCYQVASKLKETPINDTSNKTELSLDMDLKFENKQDKVRYIGAVANIKSNLYSTRFYDSWLFDAHTISTAWSMLPIYNFNINPKNINFIQRIADLKDRVQYYCEMSRLEEKCENPHHLQDIIDIIPNWDELFGRGEFPCMTIYAFRLGNTEYFTYTIGR